jgi:Leucine-rich repeat (LRR) protein
MTLMDFYDSVGAAGWESNYGWGVDTTVDNWFGITVANGHVTRIVLDEGVTFDGSLPSNGLGGLPNLRKLQLIGGQLANISESYFVNNPALEFLTFSNLGMTSLRSDAFEGLSNLYELNLSGNNFTSLPNGGFNYTPNLTNLYLSDNQITTLAEDAFSNLTNLNELYLN